MFRLCEQWMCRQTFRGIVQWIVVDDGQIPTVCTAGQEYVRVDRGPQSTRVTSKTHTVGDNLRRGLALVRSPKVLVIEDDDYYSPRYLETLSEWLDRAELVGESGAKYYRLDTQTWQHFDSGPFLRHAALARTGFRSDLIPFVAAQCDGDSSVDMRIWTRHTGSRLLAKPSISGLHVSIKGGPGRASHNYGRKLRWRDTGSRKLLEWTCGDWQAVSAYRNLFRSNPLTVFTAVTRTQGRLYSKLKAPAVRPAGVDYVCFTDSPADVPTGWRARTDNDWLIKEQNRPDLQSRLWKILPHQWFPDSEWTLYLDSSLHLTSNPLMILNSARQRWPDAEMVAVKHPLGHNVGAELDWITEKQYAPADAIIRQKAEYEVAGLLGLEAFQCGFMLRRNTERMRQMSETWWAEVQKYGHRRDQPSFPIAAHTAGVTVAAFSHSERASYTRWSGHNVERETFIS